MKIKYVVPCLFALMLFSVPLWADPPARVGRVNLIEGSVSFSPNDSGSWQAATLNYPLTTGNQLQTAAGARVEAHIGSTAVRLAADTTISFETLDDQTIQIRLEKGSLSVRLRRLDADQQVQIDTKISTVSLAEPGSFRFDQEANGDVMVTARDGAADVTTGQASIHVDAQKTLTIPFANPASYTLAGAVSPDTWDQWVASRDQTEDQVASTRYVSSEMDGVEDLDSQGTWRDFPGYGPCWVPLNVAVGWAPYHFGHWAWIDPWGWTWIDDAPWGFAPFHYGRWAFTTGIWAWVPGPIIRRPVFAPALVSWVGGVPVRGHPPDFDHNRWVPLRPREPFRPLYHVGVPYLRAINGAVIVRPRPIVRPGDVGAISPRPMPRPGVRPGYQGGVVPPRYSPQPRPVAQPDYPGGMMAPRPPVRAPIPPQYPGGFRGQPGPDRSGPMDQNDSGAWRFRRDR